MSLSAVAVRLHPCEFAAMPCFGSLFLEFIGPSAVACLERQQWTVPLLFELFAQSRATRRSASTQAQLGVGTLVGLGQVARPLIRRDVFDLGDFSTLLCYGGAGLYPPGDNAAGLLGAFRQAFYQPEERGRALGEAAEGLMPLTSTYFGPLIDQLVGERFTDVKDIDVVEFIIAAVALPGMPTSWGAELPALKIELVYDGSAPGALVASACCALLRLVEISEVDDISRIVTVEISEDFGRLAAMMSLSVNDVAEILRQFGGFAGRLPVVDDDDEFDGDFEACEVLHVALLSFLDAWYSCWFAKKPLAAARDEVTTTFSKVADAFVKGDHIFQDMSAAEEQLQAATALAEVLNDWLHQKQAFWSIPALPAWSVGGGRPPWAG